MKNQTLLRTSGMLAMLLAAPLICGCGRTTKISVKDQTVTDIQPPPPPPVSPQETTEAMKHMTVNVTADASTHEGRILANAASRRTADALTEQGIVTAGEQSDIHVQYTADATLYDKAGSYYIYDGAISVQALLAKTGGYESLGTENYALRSPRTLGLEPTLTNLGTELGNQATPWVLQRVNNARNSYKVADITVTRSIFSRRQGRSDYKVNFVERVNNQPGIKACRLLAEDERTRQMTFRIVYDPAAYPAGLLNHLRQVEGLSL